MSNKYEIVNDRPCHLETLESLIYYRDIITGVTKNVDDQITLRLKVYHDVYANYIKSVYPDLNVVFHDPETEESPEERVIEFKKKREKYKNVIYQGTSDISQSKPKDIDYQIHATIGPWDIDRLAFDTGQYYISHTVTDETNARDSIFHLTPLNNAKRHIICDKLPWAKDAVPSKIPTILCLGRLDWRDLETLVIILNVPGKFRVKILTRTPMPVELEPYANSNKLIYKNIPQFDLFHKEILEGDYMLPLTKNANGLACNKYYRHTLTSSINYGTGYNMKFIIDQELYDIYESRISDPITYSPGNVPSISSAISKALEESSS